MDIIVLSKGRIYRERDLHVQAPNGEIAILSPRNDRGGVDYIVAGEYQQRFDQPMIVKDMLSALNKLSGECLKKLEHYRLLTPEGHRVRIV